LSSDDSSGSSPPPTGPLIGLGDRKKFVRAALASAPIGWWLDTASNFTTAVERIIIAWVLDSIVDPIVGAFVYVGEAIIGTVLILAFGQDQTVGGENYGLADIWLGAAGLIAESGGAFESVLGVIEEFNQTLADLAATGGPAAPTIVSALYLLEVGGVAWVLWSIIRVIDIPLISLNGAVQVLTAPVQGILRRLR